MNTPFVAFAACLMAAILMTTACGGPSATQKMTLAQAQITKEGWRPLQHVKQDGDVSYWVACSERMGPTKGQVFVVVAHTYSGETKVESSEVVKDIKCIVTETRTGEVTPPTP